jgi:hypothetical protein
VVEAPVEITPAPAPAVEAAAAEAGPAAVAEAAAPAVVAAEAVAAEPAAPAAAASTSLPVERTDDVAGDLAGFWLGLAAQQLAHGVEVWRALAEAKSWREALDVQGEYLAMSAQRLIAGSQASIRLAGKVAGLATLGDLPARRAA